jgi:hypothetical protein
MKSRPAEQALVETIRKLSPERFAEVQDFVEFLAAKDLRQQALERLRVLRERLPQEEISDQALQEVVAEVRADRAEQRDRPGRAGRS